MEAIGAVLLKDWDPIGMKDEPMAQDEYDGYIGGVYRLLVTGATAEQIAEHLNRIEAERMGLGPVSATVRLPVAKRLLALDVRLGEGSTPNLDIPCSPL